MSFKSYVSGLESKISDSYGEGITQPEAERLAGEFLHAQMKVSEELRRSDLDARMRKSGVKAIRAAIYRDEATKTEKKPTEAMLASLVDINEHVLSEQKRFDEADVERLELERLYDIFGNAHIHFRSIAKGSFGG